MDNAALLKEFEEFCKVDLRLSKRTYVHGHVPFVERFLQNVSKPLASVQTAEIRNYLSELGEHCEPKTYNNHLGALKRFFRDYLKRNDLIETFKFAPVSEKPIIIPIKSELQSFYHALDTTKDRLLFMLYATTGLRRNEAWILRIEDINREKRMVTPNGAHKKRDN
jgi:integrase